MSDDRLETDTCQVGTESPWQELWEDGDEDDISASLKVQHWLLAPLSVQSTTLTGIMC